MIQVNKYLLCAVGVAFILACIPMGGNCLAIGIFSAKASVGDDGGKGDALFANETYEVKGSGSDIGGSADGFYWTYKEIAGNFMMKATLQWGAADVPVLNTTESVQSKKMGLMIRESANDPASRFVFAQMRREYGADIAYRLETGGSSAETPGIVVQYPGDTNTVLLIRSGSLLSMYRETENGDSYFIGQIDHPGLPLTIAAGLAVSAHSATMVAPALFSNVEITPISSLITATRKIDKYLAVPGETVSVHVTLDAGTGNVSDVALIEIPPQGYSVSSIQATAGKASLNSSGDIEWLVRGASGQAVLTYSVTVPPTLGSVRFAGVLNCGNLYTIPISGNTLIAASQPNRGKKAAVFSKFSTRSTADREIELDLQSYFGVTVTGYDDAGSANHELPADLSGLSMVYISETVTSGTVRDKNYHNSDTPIVLGEQMLMDDYTFQPEIGLGLVQDDRIEIVDNTHPITQGFSKGILHVLEGTQYLGYFDNPPAGVRILASAPGNPARARLWVIEKGTQVNGVTVNGLRIGTFLAGLDGYSSNVYADLTESGRRLILQAFAYGLDEPSPFPSAVENYMLYR